MWSLTLMVCCKGTKDNVMKMFIKYDHSLYYYLVEIPASLQMISSYCRIQKLLRYSVFSQ